MKHKLLRICALSAAALLAFGAGAEVPTDPQPSPEVSATAEAQIDMLLVDHRLYELGYRDDACNGILDEITINALRNFQIANGLPVTGDADRATVDVLLGEHALSQSQYLNLLAHDYALNPTLADGSYGDSVSRLQRTLKQLGYFTGSADGVYGDETRAAVCRFQLANGLEETGIANGTVFMRLYGDDPLSWDAFLQEGCVSVGDSGSGVRRLQLWLRQKGYFNGECTGRYGDGTQQAVKRFQADNDLEESGDVDVATGKLLYWDVSAFLRDSSALRRGETGADVESLCRDLALLGYPAHGRFNMQTELALMQFQLVNKLKVTGVADELTLIRLRSGNATPADGYAASARLMPDREGLAQQISRQATSLLGQYSELDTCFGFVQYVALKCGVELMDKFQLSQVDIGPADSINAGAFLAVEIGGREICGIANSDRSMIYRADNGYIVMGYLDAMEPERISLWHVVESV